MDPIEEIKQKLNIVDVIGSYVSLKKAGRNYRGLCPFHTEKTPSFMVSPELQIFKCFGCGEAGDIFEFYQKIEGVEFAEALRQLGDKAGVEVKSQSFDPEKDKKSVIYEINHLASEYYHYILTNHKVGETAIKYLKDKRKLTEDTIKEFKVGYAPDSWDSLQKFLNKKQYNLQDMAAAGVLSPKKSGKGYVDKFRGRIVFPLTGVTGKVLGFMGRTLYDRQPKYLNTAETAVFHKSSFVYGLDKAKVALKQEGAVFVEGPMDVISANQLGIKNVVASSGTALTSGHLKLISRYTKDVTFCFDSDEAGLTAIHRGVELAAKQDLNIKVALVPEDYDDLDEMIRESPEEAKELFSNSIPVYDFFLISALRKHDERDPIGKKKIIEELTPAFSKIGNPVTLDHYIKKISQEVGVDERVVADIFASADKADSSAVAISNKNEVGLKRSVITKNSPEEYILALLLKAPLDEAQTVLYKLGQKDFVDRDLQEIFTALKKYLLDRKKKLEIKYFVKRLDENLHDMIHRLYLQDFDKFQDNPEVFSKEINDTFDRIKRSTVRREMQELSREIRRAEMEKDTKAVKELSNKFKELSEKLV